MPSPARLSSPLPRRRAPFSPRQSPQNAQERRGDRGREANAAARPPLAADGPNPPSNAISVNTDPTTRPASAATISQLIASPSSAFVATNNHGGGWGSGSLLSPAVSAGGQQRHSHSDDEGKNASIESNSTIESGGSAIALAATLAHSLVDPVALAAAIAAPPAAVVHCCTLVDTTDSRLALKENARSTSISPVSVLEGPGYCPDGGAPGMGSGGGTSAGNLIGPVVQTQFQPGSISPGSKTAMQKAARRRRKAARQEATRREAARQKADEEAAKARQEKRIADAEAYRKQKCGATQAEKRGREEARRKEREAKRKEEAAKRKERQSASRANQRPQEGSSASPPSQQGTVTPPPPPSNATDSNSSATSRRRRPVAGAPDVGNASDARAQPGWSDGSASSRPSRDDGQPIPSTTGPGTVINAASAADLDVGWSEEGHPTYAAHQPYPQHAYYPPAYYPVHPYPLHPGYAQYPYPAQPGWPPHPLHLGPLHLGAAVPQRTEEEIQRQIAEAERLVAERRRRYEEIQRQIAEAEPERQVAEKKRQKKRARGEKAEAKKKAREAREQPPDIPDDPSLLELLDTAADSWDPVIPVGQMFTIQSADWRHAGGLCVDAGIDRRAVAFYILERNYEDANDGSGDYRKHPAFERIDKALYKLSIDPFCRLVPARERMALPPSERAAIEATLHSRLGLNERGELPDPVHTSFNAEQGESIQIHCVPVLHLVDPQTLQIDKASEWVAVKEQDAYICQETFSISKAQANAAIAEAAQSSDPKALQRLIGELHAKQTQQSPTRMEFYFYFKGIIYFVWFDVPPAVLEELEESGQLGELKRAVDEILLHVNVVKIGHSGEDLCKWLQKMMHLLTFAAGIRLCCVAIGIPFGFCESRTLEQCEHFLQLVHRINGEVHSRMIGINSSGCDIVPCITRIAERTGGRVICHGTVGSAVPLSSAVVRPEDGEGHLYAWMLAWSEQQRKVFWRVYNAMKAKSNDRGCAFAVKVGATLGDDFEKRVRAGFWVWSLGRADCWAVEGYPKVFEAEKRWHNKFAADGLHLSGERFNLLDENGETKQFAEFKQMHKQRVQFTVHPTDFCERMRNKERYSVREAREWISLGIVTFGEIVDRVMDGVVVLL